MADTSYLFICGSFFPFRFCTIIMVKIFGKGRKGGRERGINRTTLSSSKLSFWFRCDTRHQSQLVLKRISALHGVAPNRSEVGTWNQLFHPSFNSFDNLFGDFSIAERESESGRERNSCCLIDC